MPADLLDSRAWTAASSVERDAAARRLAQALPLGFVYEGLRTHRMGETQNEVAHLTYKGASFVFVPGGEATLGFDAVAWVPTADEASGWDELLEEFDLSGTLPEYVDRNTTAVRLATVPPMLAEVEATAPDEEGPLAAISTQEADAGFRLPTDDEWEWLCAGGARTLYRWGDHAPSPIGPYDLKQASFGTTTEEAPVHRRPNAFGLRIADDTYRKELVDGGERTRGGDGGVTECGGASPVASWLLLATAAKPTKRERNAPLMPWHEFARRVLPLA